MTFSLNRPIPVSAQEEDDSLLHHSPPHCPHHHQFLFISSLLELAIFDNLNSSITFCLNATPKVVFFFSKHVFVNSHHSSRFTPGI
uniref:Uncharacterized protein n=1 Tax=Populus trichocarpa TaxID=3694 RepID=A0A2K2A8Q7_POPTR